MPSRVTLIGIDGMDFEIVTSLMQTRLPNVAQICHDGILRRIDSVFPPDSDTAWSTIFTGMNPAQHGMVKFVDPLEKSISYKIEDPQSHTLKGRYVWDRLSEKGSRVCVVLPHAAFPPWPVNGIMISRSSSMNEVRCEPKDALTRKQLDGLRAPKGFPGRSERSLDEYIHECRDLFSNTRDVSLGLHDRENWDFFFVYSPILDIIPHFFWRYHDKDDPAYPGPNPYEDLIPQLYEEHDRLIATFRNRMREGDLTIVMSDHGHGRRPVHEYRMNELLRREGLLRAKDSHGPKHGRGVQRTVSDLAIRLTEKYALGNVISSLMSAFPAIRQRVTRPSWIDWERSVAATVDMSGIKSYSYGGIRINQSIPRDSDEYETIRDRIIVLILNSTDCTSDTKVALWAKRREELYEGPFTDRYPDIVYQLKSDYGFSPDLGKELIRTSRARSVVPGTHIGSNAILLVTGEAEQLEHFKSVDIDGITETIANLLLCPQREQHGNDDHPKGRITSNANGCLDG